MDEDDLWPARPWILAGVGGAVGFSLYLLSRGGVEGSTARTAFAAMLVVAGLLLGLTLDRFRWRASIGFSIAGGAVMAGLVWWNGGAAVWDGPEGWRLLSAALALALLAPVYQAFGDAGHRGAGWSLPYPMLFSHVCTNIIIGAGALAFVGLVWLLALLLSALFDLIGIRTLLDLLDDRWFGATLTGTALGAAFGLLRGQRRIVGLFQNAVIAILRVLAPLLGLGLLAFLLALPFTGLESLWQATKSTTPILLACAVGALILCNAVVGASRAEEAEARVLRWGALLLALALLPLAVIAAVSTGLRIQQHGFTPERLWALTAVIVSTVIAIAYVSAILRARAGWMDRIRPANRSIALGVIALALLLSTPLVSFAALSARDQLARLESGRVTPERFDWAALAFDFGPQGRRALERLRATATPAVRVKAAEALAATDRFGLSERTRAANAAVDFARRVRIIPRPAAVPPGLVEAVTRFGQCGTGPSGEHCVLRYEPGTTEAVLVRLPARCDDCEPVVQPLVAVTDGRWASVPRDMTSTSPEPEERAARARRLAGAVGRGEIDVRPVPRRQVFIGGEPIGPAFE